MATRRSNFEGLTKRVGYAFVVPHDVWTGLSNKRYFEALGERAAKWHSAIAI